MNERQQITLSAIISTISALLVFFISTKINTIKNDKILFKKLWIKIYEMIITLTNLKSSSYQYIKLMKFNLEEIWSIGFPEYAFKEVIELFPSSIYCQKNDLLNNLTNLHWVIFSLNETIWGLYINQIKEDLLNKTVSLDISKERYLNEVKYVQSIVENIDSYINLAVNTKAHINLINEKKQRFDFIYFKINFSQEKIKKEINKIEVQLWRNKKIEDFSTSK